MEITPDCYIVNSSGQMHPYLYGSACDFGLKISIAVIGFTNKLLFGNLKENFEESPYIEVVHKKHLIGYAIPKPNSKKYLYISVGNHISLETALNIFLVLDQNLISSLKMELHNFISSSLNRKV
jgi:deoxyinosine 3'endonuclease (endonuclease V)